MKKGVLIISANKSANTHKATGLMSKTIDIFSFLIPNKIYSLIFEQEQIVLYIVRIPDVSDLKVSARIKRIFEWIDREGISVVSFDKYFLQNHGEHISKHDYMVAEVSFGDNILFSLVIRTLKKILKSKGLDIDQVDTAIISDGKSRYEIDFIKYLSPHVKYLTYVCQESIKIKRLIDDIFDNLGISIRVCTNIKECIGDIGLIVNLAPKTVIPKNLYSKNKTVIYDMYGVVDTNKENISILNDIIIDIPMFEIPIDINNLDKYALCEMFILLKLNKLHLLKQYATEHELQEIYECFKKMGSKIIRLDGINL